MVRGAKERDGQEEGLPEEGGVQESKVEMIGPDMQARRGRSDRGRGGGELREADTGGLVIGRDQCM